MALYVKGKEVISLYVKGKIVTAIYFVKQLLWILGNFFTNDGDVFMTADGEVFVSKEEE